MMPTIMKGLMFGGFALFALAFLLKPTENWKWGQKHFWKLGIVGLPLMLVGVVVLIILAQLQD